MFKKVIAGALSTVICCSTILSDGFSGLKAATPSAPPSTALQDESDVRLEGSNSLSSYLAESATAHNTNASANFPVSAATEETFSIGNMGFDPESGEIVLSTTQTSVCKAVIEFIDESTGKTALTVETILQKGESVMTLARADVSKLPAYYTIAARLENVRGELLSNVFKITKYTEAVQEIIATDIHDFEEEKVVNLDESEETNFLVLNEETVLAETTETENILRSADYDNNVYVFDGISKDLRGLQRNDYFYIQPTAEDIIAIQVEDVTIDGDCATISGNDDIEDMFDFIKIDTNTATDATVEDAVIVDAEESDEAADTELSAKDALCKSIEAQDLSDDEQKPVRKTPLSVSVDNGKVKFTMGIETSNESYNSLDNSVTTKVAANIELTVTPDLFFYKSFNDIIIEFTLDFHAEVSFSASYTNSTTANAFVYDRIKTQTRDGETVSSEPYIEFKKYDKDTQILFSTYIATSVAGLGINAKVEFFQKIEGAVSLSLSKDFKKGLKYSTDDGFSAISEDSPVFTPSGSIKGSFSAGFNITIGPDFLKILKLNLVITPMISLVAEGSNDNNKYAYIGGQYGLTNDASYQTVFYNSESKKSLSYCDGQISVSFQPSLGISLEASIGASIFKVTWKHKFLTLKPEKSLSGKICSNAKTGLDFHWGECPHQAYRVDFKIFCVNTEYDVQAPESLILKVDGLDFPFALHPNDTSDFHLYCKPSMEHSYTLYWDKIKVADGYFTMEAEDVLKKQDDAKSVRINLTQHTAEDGTVSFDTATVNISSADAITTMPATTAPVTTTVTTTTTTRPLAQQIIERKQLSEQDFSSHDQPFDSNIAGYLYGDHHLVIAGYGRMKDFTQCPFPNPDAITSVTILDSDPENGLYIENIGAHLFDGCTNLTSLYSDNEGKVEGQQISFPSTMSEIGDFAFAGCTEIENIVIPDHIITLGNNVFNQCSKLKNAEIIDTDRNLHLGAHIFNECSAIESLTLPYADFTEEQNTNVSAYQEGKNNLTQYLFTVLTNPSKEVFETYSYLNHYVHPDGHHYVHYYCAPKNLKNLTITGGQSIPKEAFMNLPQLETVVLSDSITEIGESAFSVLEENSRFITDPHDSIISSPYFAPQSSLTDFNLPKNIKNIGDYAFANCVNIGFGQLTSWESLETIGAYAFQNCLGLTGLVIPDSCQSVGDCAFHKCSKLETIEMIDTDKDLKIGAHIFNECSKIASLTLPYADLQYSNADAYSHTGNSICCYLFTSFINTDPETVSEKLYLDLQRDYSEPDHHFGIHYYAPKSLMHFIIKGGDTIPASAFVNMTALQTVTLGKSITSIGDSAFSGCTGLTAFNVELSEDEWSKVTIGSGNDVLETVTINYNYEIPETLVPETHLYGDVDGDGKVKIFDAVLLCQYIAEMPCNISSEGLICADSTHDGLVTMDDVTQILKIIARLV